MSKRYRVELTPEQRQELKDLISTGKPSNATNRHARILLKADGAPGGPQWTDEQISDALEVSVRTVARVRQSFVQAGLDRTLHRQPRSDAQRSKMDGRAEAQLVALVCSAPPEGGPAGPCSSSPTGWSSWWTSWRSSPTRRCGGC